MSILRTVFVILCVAYTLLFFVCDPTRTFFNDADGLIRKNIDDIVGVTINEKDHTAQLELITNISYNVRFLATENFKGTLQRILGEKYNDIKISYYVPYSMWDIITFGIMLYILYSFIADVVYKVFFGLIYSKSSDDEDSKSNFNFTGTNSNASYYKIIKNSKVSFKDVIGYEGVKKDLMECTKYIQYRADYVKAGCKLPRGILFYGSPGTGKTLMAKAFASESGATFISTSGSAFNEVYMGTGAKRVRELFSLARKYAPSILFIDEIDALGSRNGKHGSLHSEYNSTINALLSEMDGFNPNDNVIVIGTTNLPDRLDDAMTRSGRFDYKMVFELPNINERKLMLKYYLTKVMVHPDFTASEEENINKLARLTASLTGADIANITNQASFRFMKRQNIVDGKFILDNNGSNFDDFLKAIDEVVIGQERRERLMTEEERKYVAFHESGHTLCSYTLQGTTPPLKTSIIPRGANALGFTQQESVDKKLNKRSEILNMIAVLLGGRAAEEIVYNDVTTGAHDDFQRATKLCHNFITTFGMSNLGIPDNTENLGDKTKSKINKKVNDMLNKIYEYSKKIIVDNRSDLDNLANHLLEKEVIYREDIERIIAPEKRGIYNVSTSLKDI
jgi:cell division protease FtsH